MARYPNAIGGTYQTLSPIADQERTVNFYIERMEVPGAKSRAVLYPSPGVRTFADFSSDPVMTHGRGMFAQDGRCFAVIGTKFVELTPSGGSKHWGDIPYTLGVSPPIAPGATPTIDPVTMSTNGDGGGQLFITGGNNGYIFDLDSNAFSQPADRTNKTFQGGMLDGYFFALDVQTSTLYLSELLDGTNWRGPDQTETFTQRQISPDKWVAAAVNYREIWLFGSETSEVWVNTGTFPFPFAVHPSGLIPYGIAAPFSVKAVAGTLIWLARTSHGTGQVVAASGFRPQVISTHALHAEIETYETISDAIGDTIELFGHPFYILTFPKAGRTWVYDMTTQLWFEWLTWIAEARDYTAWRPLFHAQFDDRNLMLDRASGKVLELHRDFGLDVEEREIRRMRRFPGLTSELKRTFYREFTLYMETGLGLLQGQGERPLVAMRTSNDGGKTWGNERTQMAGRIGEYKVRVQFQNCGSGRDRCFEVVMTDPVPWRIVDAFLEAKTGDS